MSALEHYDSELAELDRQIVRLGTLCGLDATQQATITGILNGSIQPADEAAERKMFVLLKGLLALRYHVEKHCLDEIGPDRCQQLLESTLLK